MKCYLCNNKKNFKLIWNDKIRSSRNNFTINREKILQGENCDLVFLKKKKKFLQNSAISRNIYNKNNSITEFLKFHKPREMHKIKYIKKRVNLENKKILESNCGAGILINYLKNKKNITAGLDNIFYKKDIEKNGHLFFPSIHKIIQNRQKFDIILSLSELEHKYDPKKFLINLKKILNNKGKLIVRIPNFNNIYMLLLGNNFLKFDFRTSHNFYFSKKNLDLIFAECGYKTLSSFGINEYNFNHLLSFIKEGKRISQEKIHNYFSKNINKRTEDNIEKNLLSTSLIYILTI